MYDTNHLLKLIEEERLCFIKAEFARLQSVMGDEYHIGSETHIFHPLPQSSNTDMPALGNPEELSLAELSLLPQLEKCIPRLGTLSYMPLFRMHPNDSARINLLANMQEKIIIGKVCSRQEVETLISGHDDYMKSKTQYDDVVIITK